MAKKIGLDAVLYRSATVLDDDTNTPALATWIEMGNVRDVTLNLEKGEADVTTRGNNGWRARRGTLKDGSLDLEMIVDPEDADYQAVRNAYMNNTEIALAAMSGDITEEGEEGLAANYEVFSFTRNEPLEDAMTVSVTLRPSSEITWHTVAGD